VSDGIAANDVERAVTAFQESLRLHWKLAAAHINLGLVLEHLHKWNDALRHYELAVQFDPEAQAARANLERLTQRLQAIERLRKAGAIVV
jgi:tetratricopeptide (TPR) repeat protein